MAKLWREACQTSCMAESRATACFAESDAGKTTPEEPRARFNAGMGIEGNSPTWSPCSRLRRQAGGGNAMIPSMEPLHISEGDLARDIRSILQRVESGAEVIIERDAQPVAVLRPAEPVRRKISECIALLPADSSATIDPDFAKDVEAAIAAHREPLEPPAWD